MHAFEEELRPVVNLTYQHGPSSQLTGMILAVVTAVDILWNLMFRFYFISSRKIIAEDFRKFFAVSGARNEVKGFSSWIKFILQFCVFRGQMAYITSGLEMLKPLKWQLRFPKS